MIISIYKLTNKEALVFFNSFVFITSILKKLPIDPNIRQIKRL